MKPAWLVNPSSASVLDAEGSNDWWAKVSKCTNNWHWYIETTLPLGQGLPQASEGQVVAAMRPYLCLLGYTDSMEQGMAEVERHIPMFERLMEAAQEDLKEEPQP